MTKEMHVFCGVGCLQASFTVNALADAIVKCRERIELHDLMDFGGRSSAAFREGLVKEYNKAHAKECPECGMPLLYTEPDRAKCSACSKLVLDPELGREKCYVDEEGVAEFVGRRIGNNFANHTGDYFHLGEVHGRTLYFGANPSKRFYAAHKGDAVALVLGSNKAEVPENWSGHVAYLSELFYVNEPTGEIRVSHNILKGLLPVPNKGNAKHAERMIHERRNEWLMFAAHLFAKPLVPENFFRGVIKPKVVCEWFVQNYPTAPQSYKTYKRDYNEFRHFNAKDDEVDKREAFIVLLLRTAANKKLTMKERLGIAKLIPELVIFLNDAASRNPSRPAEITRGAWQHCKDGSKEYVPIVEIEKFFDDLAKRMGEDAA